MNDHDKNKNFFEYFAKNILKSYDLINDFEKSESPDWIDNKNKIGLEIVRADETRNFSGYIEKYNPENCKDILSFNKEYENKGGRVLSTDDAIVKILNLHVDNSGYCYISPAYNDDFSFININIENKLEKLNEKYKDLDKYYLAIITPVYIPPNNVKSSQEYIGKIQSKFVKKYSIIFIICSDKIIIYNFEKNNSSIIAIEKKIMHDIADITSNEINSSN